MKKNRWVLRLLALLALCGVLNVTALAVEAGSSRDPLVTLSYLNDTFLGTIMTQVDQKIAARNSQIAQQMGGQGSVGTTASSSFVVVTLSNGQTLKGDIGCEVMLRVGTAVCVASSTPGLVDESAATTQQRRCAGTEPPLPDDDRKPGRKSDCRYHQAAGAGELYHRLSVFSA